MKNTLFIGTILCLLMTLSSCIKDNFEGPDATIYGSILDEADGSLVEQDMLNGSRILAFEHGYDNPNPLVWDFKYNGEYRNNLVFANTYDLYLRNGNFFPQIHMDFEIKPGDNNVDFTVVPYLRIKDASIVYDQTGDSIVATFRVEAADPSVQLFRITLYAFSDIYVGDPYKFILNGENYTQMYKPAIPVDPDFVHTLSISLAENENTFIKGRDYFFRIGAQGDGDDLVSVKYNYVPNVKIRL